ncbi:MAG: ribonuclease H-like domain-containing protein [Patescibacteria group bacterium]
MKSGDIVFDIETQKSFDEVGGRDFFDKLGVSVIAAYIYGGDKYIAYEEHEIPEFEKLLKSVVSNGRRVIGFNIHNFDIPVLQPYISWNLKELPTLDLMDDVEKSAGFRISLDNLCTETLGAKKSADGMQALRWYKEGKIDEIKKYCIKDVELTKALYEYGAKNGKVTFFSRDSRSRVALPVRWGMETTVNVRSILKDGFDKRKSVEIEYVSRDVQDDGELVPARVVDIHKILNDTFEGYCHLRQAKRIFKIDRVTSARLTDNSYKMVQDIQTSLL